jgi:hypothetical protein
MMNVQFAFPGVCCILSLALDTVDHAISKYHWHILGVGKYERSRF